MLVSFRQREAKLKLSPKDRGSTLEFAENCCSNAAAVGLRRVSSARRQSFDFDYISIGSASSIPTILLYTGATIG
jgi:hypothetical protein